MAGLIGSGDVLTVTRYATSVTAGVKTTSIDSTFTVVGRPLPWNSERERAFPEGYRRETTISIRLFNSQTQLRTLDSANNEEPDEIAIDSRNYVVIERKSYRRGSGVGLGIDHERYIVAEPERG